MKRFSSLSALILVSLATPSEACWPFGHHHHSQAAYAVQVQTYATYPVVQAAPQCATGVCPAAPAKTLPPTIQAIPQAPAKSTPQAALQPQGDSTGFLVLVNAERQRRGLRALLYDAGLTGWCHRNNAEMIRFRRSVHAVNPGFYQCSFYGVSTAQQAFQGWMASGGHASILLNPQVTMIGVSGDPQGCWTANLR